MSRSSSIIQRAAPARDYIQRGIPPWPELTEAEIERVAEALVEGLA
jgi:hypothetical protein